MSDSTWYAARATGTVALMLLAVVTALGVATRGGRPLPLLPRSAVVAVHRSTALLTAALLGVHVLSLSLDRYAHVDLGDWVVPFGVPHRPVWTGLGTLALDLLAALVVTSLLRARLGLRAWRAVHLASYALFPLALLHGLGTGTDAGRGWLRGCAAASAGLVLAAWAWRLRQPGSAVARPALRADRPARAPRRVAAASPLGGLR